MRGFISLGRSIVNEVREFGLRDTAANVWADCAKVVDRHFGHYLGGATSAIFVRLPWTPISAWLEWREINLGAGIERSVGMLEVWLGRLQIVVCKEGVKQPREML